MTDKPQVQIRLLMAADARLYREIRLEALQLSPEAFGSTLEHERSQSLVHFEDALTKSDVFGAFHETDNLVGMAGYRTQGGAKQAHKGLLWGMYVRPIARGTGVAKHLVKAISGMRANASNYFNWQWLAKMKQPDGSIAISVSSSMDTKFTP